MERCCRIPLGRKGKGQHKSTVNPMYDGGGDSSEDDYMDVDEAINQAALTSAARCMHYPPCPNDICVLRESPPPTVGSDLYYLPEGGLNPNYKKPTKAAVEEPSQANAATPVRRVSSMV